MNKFAIIILVIIVSCYLFISFFGNWGAKLNPKEAYKRWISNPIPSNVKIIDGYADVWQGAYGTVIFETDTATFDEISETYELSKDCKNAIYKTNRFFKNNLNDIGHLICFERTSPIQSGCSTCDHTYYSLFWDSKKNTAYFYGMED